MIRVNYVLLPEELSTSQQKLGSFRHRRDRPLYLFKHKIRFKSNALVRKCQRAVERTEARPTFRQVAILLRQACRLDGTGLQFGECCNIHDAQRDVRPPFQNCIPPGALS